MTSNVNKLIFWVVIICLAVILYTVVGRGKGKPEVNLAFSQFLSEVEAGRVKSVKISGTEVRGQFVDDSQGPLRTLIPANYPKVYEILTAKNVAIEMQESTNGTLVSLLVNAIPFVLLLALWILALARAGRGYTLLNRRR
jgi:cell division protease FtsH